MKSTVMKRSIVISGHKTSISLEDPFWSGLKEIAKSNQATLSSIVADIESSRQYGNLILGDSVVRARPRQCASALGRKSD